MTREEVLKANQVIDEQMKALDAVWEAALATREAAQKTLDEIRQMRAEAQQKQLANLRSVEG
jgi:cytochrome c556